MVFACASYAKIVVLLQCPEPGSLDGPYYTPTWADFGFTWGSFGSLGAHFGRPKRYKEPQKSPARAQKNPKGVLRRFLVGQFAPILGAWCSLSSVLGRAGRL